MWNVCCLSVMCWCGSHLFSFFRCSTCWACSLMAVLEVMSGVWQENCCRRRIKASVAFRSTHTHGHEGHSLSLVGRGFFSFVSVFQPHTAPRLSLISPPRDGRMGMCSAVQVLKAGFGSLLTERTSVVLGSFYSELCIWSVCGLALQAQGQTCYAA